jgi:hypothetical protein
MGIQESREGEREREREREGERERQKTVSPPHMQAVVSPALLLRPLPDGLVSRQKNNLKSKTHEPHHNAGGKHRLQARYIAGVLYQSGCSDGAQWVEWDV